MRYLYLIDKNSIKPPYEQTYVYDIFSDKYQQVISEHNFKEIPIEAMPICYVKIQNDLIFTGYGQTSDFYDDSLSKQYKFPWSGIKETHVKILSKRIKLGRNYKSDGFFYTDKDQKKIPYGVELSNRPLKEFLPFFIELINSEGIIDSIDQDKEGNYYILIRNNRENHVIVTKSNGTILHEFQSTKDRQILILCRLEGSIGLVCEEEDNINDKVISKDVIYIVEDGKLKKIK